ncbi:hypothetical protein V8J88_19860 [Massilia sp. W12]|uniref:hypothetical protein n=1 Tax=Massilia sp. W12 TaxID=3126507 RepID=UPI0030D140AF
MYRLPASIAYRLEYAFCQQELDDMLGCKSHMAQLGGVGAVLALDWLQARLCQRAFVLSMHSLREPWLSSQPALPPAQRAPLNAASPGAAFSQAGAQDLLQQLGCHSGMLLRLDGDTRSHQLCIVRQSDSWLMFDPDSGEYRADSLAGCAQWLHDLCQLRQAWRGGCLSVDAPLIFRAPGQAYAAPRFAAQY